MALAMTQSRVVGGRRIVVKTCRSRAVRASVAARAAVQLPPLPFDMNALEPHMSKQTLEFHWGKHHKAYVDNLNKQIEGKPLANKTLEEIVVETWNNGQPTPEFNNAGQIWNHNFFWEGIGPNGGGEPSGPVAEAINKSFGSFAEFKKQFAAAGATQFGSGWAWLVTDKAGNLAVTKTPNAVTPVVEGKTPILTMDVWEHAYYLDFQNRRPDFINTFIDQLINWDKVNERFQAAKQ